MRKSVQWLRRGVQLLVLLGIIAIPCIAHYRTLLIRNKLEPLRTQTSHTLPQKAVLGMDRVVQGLASTAASEEEIVRRQKLADQLGHVRGNHWSEQIFGLSWTDPLAGLESILTSGAATTTLMVGLLVPVMVTLLLGRVFCSWICPAGLLFEMTDKVRKLLGRLKQPVHNVAFWRGNKYTLLGVGILVSAAFGIPLLGGLYPPALLGREIHRIVDAFFQSAATPTGNAAILALTGATLFIFGIILTEVFVSRRAWCRSFCPGGALYSLLGRRRVVRLRNDAAACSSCRDCINVCPMALNPMLDAGMECDHCLLCVSACETGSLSLVVSTKPNSSQAHLKANPETAKEAR